MLILRLRSWQPPGFPVVDWYHSTNGEVDMPVIWTKRWGHGRVFYNSLGHHDDIFEIPEAWKLMQRGLLWAAEGKRIAREQGLTVGPVQVGKENVLMEKLKVGIIGVGKISSIYLENLTGMFLDFVSVTAVADILPERATGVAEAYGIPSAQTPGELLAKYKCRPGSESDNTGEPF